MIDTPIGWSAGHTFGSDRAREPDGRTSRHQGGGMQITRYVLAGTLAVLLAAGVSVGVAGAAEADIQGNRGWTAPVGAADEFADRSD